MPLEVCPDESELLAFAVGDLAPDQGEEISDHVARCALCERGLERHEMRAGEFVRALCVDPAQDAFSGEPELQLALKSVRQIEQVEHDAAHASGGSASTSDSPRQIGDYELLQVIGRGAMGTVYKARHGRLRRFVALKVLAEHRSVDQRAASRFGREMRAVGNLNHQNIVQASDAGEVDGMLYLAMQFVDGLDLSRIVASYGPLRTSDACEVIRQAAEGLEYARRNGIVHRDVKPSNLILDDYGIVRVLDLGLALLDARHDQHVHERTLDGQIMGTLGYMAPEQLDDSHQVDTRADVYSLGATLYRLLTGRTPIRIDSKTPLQRLRALASEDPTPIRGLRGDLPSALANTIDQMVCRDQSKRPSTPGEVAIALKPFTTGCNLNALIVRSRSQEVVPVGNALKSTSDRLALETSVRVELTDRAARRKRFVPILVTFLAAFLGMYAAVSFLPGPPESNTGGIAETQTESVASLDHQLIGWVFAKGGQATIAMASDPYDVRTPASVDELPEEAFVLTGINLAGLELDSGDVERIVRSNRLQYLGFAHSNVSDEDLAHITGLPLYRLDLTQTKITNRGIENLGALPGLRSLILRGTKIGDTAVEMVCEKYDVTEIDLSETALTGECMVRLSQETQLESIEFELTSVGDESARHLLNLKLRKLNTWQTLVSPELNQKFEDLLAANQVPP